MGGNGGRRNGGFGVTAGRERGGRREESVTTGTTMTITMMHFRAFWRWVVFFPLRVQRRTRSSLTQLRASDPYGSGCAATGSAPFAALSTLSHEPLLSPLRS